MDFVTETTLLVFVIILAILMIPLLIGAGIALLVGAAGLKFFGIVILVALIIWIAFSIPYFLWV